MWIFLSINSELDGDDGGGWVLGEKREGKRREREMERTIRFSIFQVEGNNVIEQNLFPTLKEKHLLGRSELVLKINLRGR